jgi:FkbM family methyltransferase
VPAWLFDWRSGLKADIVRSGDVLEAVGVAGSMAGPINEGVKMLPRVNMVRCNEAEYLLFSTDDFISRTLYLSGSWDHHLLALSKLFYAGVEAPFVLDIGANLGAYTVPIAKDIQATNGTVYSYEPQKVVYYQLCGNIFLNRLDNVDAFREALGDFDGIIKIPSVNYSTACNIGAFSMEANVRIQMRHLNEIQEEISIDTPVRRLDGMNFPKPPCLIKMDVEGMELSVLEGGKEFLRKNGFPPILFEVLDLEWAADRKDQIFGLLNGLGYEIKRIYRDDYVAQHPRHSAAVGLDTDEHGTIHMARTR